MIYYVANQKMRLCMGVVLLVLSVWFVFSSIVFSGVLYVLFTVIILILGVNVSLDGIGVNKLMVTEHEVVLYRLPFFIKRIPLSMIDRLDYEEVVTVFGNKEVVRMYYSASRHIRISNYSTQSALIKIKIEEMLSSSTT